jgi:hypothetical protein
LIVGREACSETRRFDRGGRPLETVDRIKEGLKGSFCPFLIEGCSWTKADKEQPGDADASPEGHEEPLTERARQCAGAKRLAEPPGKSKVDERRHTKKWPFIRKNRGGEPNRSGPLEGTEIPWECRERPSGVREFLAGSVPRIDHSALLARGGRGVPRARFLATCIFREAVQNPIDKCRRILGSVELCEFDRFVEEDGDRDVGLVEDLVGANAEQVPIDAGHALQAPMDRRLLDRLIEAGERRLDPLNKDARVVATFGLSIESLVIMVGCA